MSTDNIQVCLIYNYRFDHPYFIELRKVNLCTNDILDDKIDQSALEYITIHLDKGIGIDERDKTEYQLIKVPY